MTTPTSFDSTVNSFYLAFYGRPADPAGLGFWSQQLASVNGDLHAISAAFSTSEEAATRFASESAGARIADIYQSLFNRAPDAAGLAYWLDAIENGHATMANVAIEILKGAQGTDHTLADLRQQAMDSFTAQVKASGTEYSGYASVEAARVLVRAVTLETSGADLDALVKAAVSFADTATKTPAVVNAIATGSTLLAMYDTARGLGDPVALTQALADTAKAAAGNPVTLDSLLRGGGMAQVLKVMPAAATLQDVVDALATGGLPAAVEVVYPTAPVAPVAPVTPVAPAAPTFSLQFAFKEVAQGAGDTHADNVTNVASADVKFSYTGTGLKAGQHVEYSVDGGATWHADGITVSAADHSVVIAGVDLAQGAAASSGSIQHIMTAIENLPNLLTTVSVRAVDAGGATTTPVSQQIVYDHFVATPRIALVNDTAGADVGNGHDMITKDGSFTLGRIEAGATVEYQLDTVVTASYGPDTHIAGLPPLPASTVIPGTTWTADAPTLHEGLNSFTVRQRDAAGNVSGTEHVEITVDTKAPGSPTIALATDSGIAGDDITAVGKVAITGLDTDVKTAWEYSTNGGETWTFGQANDGSGQAELPLTAAGEQYVLVRQVDLAGNVGVVSNQIAFTIDPNAPVPVPEPVPVPVPAPEFAFKGVTQGPLDAQLDNVTNVAHPEIQFGYAGELGGYRFEYSLDGMTWSNEGVVAADNVVTVSNVDLAMGLAPSAGGIFPMPQPGMSYDPSMPFPGNPNFMLPPANLETTVQLRIVDADGNAVGNPVSQKIVFDSYAQPVNAVPDAYIPFVGYGPLTKSAAWSVYGNEEGATVEYLVDKVTSPLIVTPDALNPYDPIVQQPTVIAGTEWTKDKPVLAEGYNSIAVRQTDAAGNVSAVTHMTVVLDSEAPAAPAVTLVEDTGAIGDAVTSNGNIRITGLETGFLGSWEFHREGDTQWYRGGDNDGTGQAEKDMRYLLGEGAVGLQVRQVDAAGNEGAASDMLRFTIDKTAPAGNLVFKYVEAPHMLENAITDLASASVTFEYTGEPGADDLFQYRVDSGDWITLGADAYDSQTHQLVTGKVDLSQADHKVEVRAIDKAGNAGPSTDVQIDSTVNNPPAEKSIVLAVNPDPSMSWVLNFSTDQYRITPTDDTTQGGLANKASLSLSSMSHGNPMPTADNYMDGNGFHVDTNQLNLDAMPQLDFYQLAWKNDTFHTDAPSGNGYVAEGNAFFVAGAVGAIAVQGFGLSDVKTVVADVHESNSDSSNIAYVDNGMAGGRIHTGGGMDAVVLHGSEISLVYDTFDPNATDVVFGFQSGLNAIELEGDAAMWIDTNRDGNINWSSNSSGAAVMANSSTEGVQISATEVLSNNADGMSALVTASRLNNKINVADLHVGDGLLILANGVDQSTLLYYREANGNGSIDANEFVFVAVSSDGIIQPLDIQLVGSALGGGIEG